MKVQNPLIKNPNSWRRRFHVWLCHKYGHITHGAYYGMAQGHCRRCGAKLSNCSEGCPDWVEPWNEYEEK